MSNKCPYCGSPSNFNGSYLIGYDCDTTESVDFGGDPEINRSETCIARKEKQMTKIPFSQELREKYNLGPATEQDYQSEYIERELTELKKYLSKMAERKRVELSIFFVGYPTDGDMFNFRYNIPKSAYNMQPDMKKAAVKFLTDEDFYFIEWHNHIVVNLVKKPHVVGDAKCN